MTYLHQTLYQTTTYSCLQRTFTPPSREKTSGEFGCLKILYLRGLFFFSICCLETYEIDTQEVHTRLVFVHNSPDMVTKKHHVLHRGLVEAHRSKWWVATVPGVHVLYSHGIFHRTAWKEVWHRNLSTMLHIIGWVQPLYRTS